MTARRQSSTTSLARFARATDPDELSPRSLDFCNAFWGLADGGVEVLFARMRGAGRTMEEIRGFWRERAAIEDDYAKRLGKLSKLTLGRDEIGELRLSLDTLRAETERQASAHLALAQSMRRELEAPATEFIGKQVHHKKNAQATVEKQWKTKQAQESFVAKAREKYKTDCMNINLYTAQSTLVQGKDLDKIQMKLEKAKQTVQQNERDYSNSVAVLQDTCHKWEADWKVFCDQCQDLEDERIEFMKDNMWTYANAVSTVCVSDDESCEKVRVTLEQLEPEKDMENFVREYGTGANIPDPPRFHSYAGSQEPQPRPATRPSNYHRSSGRSSRGIGYANPPPQSEDDLPGPNNAGVGAGRSTGSRAGASGTPTSEESHPPTRSVNSSGPLSESSTLASSQPPPRANITQAPPQHPSTYPGHQVYAPAVGVNAPPGAPRPQAGPGASHVELVVGSNSYPVNPDADPQGRPGPSHSTVPPSQSTPATVGGPDDPIIRALKALQDGSSTRSRTPGSIRRDGRTGSIKRGEGGDVYNGPERRDTFNDRVNASNQLPVAQPPQQRSLSRSPSRKPAPMLNDDDSNFSPAPSSGRLDLQTAADSLVGAHPSSRPSSPAAPSPQPQPVFMRPPPMTTSPASIPEEYGAALPGERRISRQLNVAMASGESQSSRPVSRPTSPNQQPFAGIGAHGRSPSPQPGGPPSRAPSPNLRPISVGALQQPQRGSSPMMSAPTHDPRQMQRVPSPSSIGIALDSRGQVAHDAVADDYARRNAQYQAGQAPQQRLYQQPQPRQSYPPPQPQPGQQQYAPPNQQIYQEMPPQPLPQSDPRVRQSVYGDSGPQRSYGMPPNQQLPISGPPRQSSLNSPPGPPQVGSGPQRQPSYHAPPNTHPGYQGGGYAQNMRQPPPSQVPARAPPVSQPPPGPPAQMYPSQSYPQHPQQPVYPKGPSAQQPHTNGYGGPSHGQPIQRNTSVSPANGYSVPIQTQQSMQRQPSVSPSSGYYNQPIQQAPAPGPGTGQQNYQHPSTYRQGQQPLSQLHQPTSMMPPQSHNPNEQTGAPIPPNQGITEYLEDGTAVLFYVKALYDYQATIDEEFDFQVNDIIAVTATPEDGWWSGVLLDDARRVPGRTTFPSNFVCLF